jgi:acyl-CoA thioesterase I
MRGAARQAKRAASSPTQTTEGTPAASPSWLVPGTRRILAIGNSLTAGYGVAPSDSYPAQLSRRLGIPVDNAGVSGEISLALLHRLPRVLARRNDYDLVLLCTGGNDLLRGQPARALRENLRRAIACIREAGATPVLLALPYVPLSPALDHPVYEQVARDTGTRCIGGLGQRLTRRHFQIDGVHPNAQGYRQIVERLLEA